MSSLALSQTVWGAAKKNYLGWVVATPPPQVRARVNPKKCPRTNEGIPIFTKAVEIQESDCKLFSSSAFLGKAVLVFLLTPVDGVGT